MAKSFIASAIQIEVKAHYMRGISAEQQRKENLDRIINKFDLFLLMSTHQAMPETSLGSAELKDLGNPVKLMVFPESFLHGFGPPRSRTLDVYKEMAIKVPGPETEALGSKCKEHKMYVAGTAYETDDKYPGHVFNCGFIIGPEGKVDLKYRKLGTSNNVVELASSPTDLGSRHNQDLKSLFPVLETDYGNMGMFICWDGGFPEIARALAFNGAEIFIRPNNWFRGTYEALEVMTINNRARAMENYAYLITPNWAASPESEYPASCCNTMILDYRGRIMSQRISDAEAVVATTLNVNELREYRRNNNANPLKQMRNDVFSRIYASVESFPPAIYENREPFQSLDEKYGFMAQITQNLIKQGIMK